MNYRDLINAEFVKRRKARPFSCLNVRRVHLIRSYEFMARLPTFFYREMDATE
jgi:hypothetical protein